MVFVTLFVVCWLLVVVRCLWCCCLAVSVLVVCRLLVVAFVAFVAVLMCCFLHGALFRCWLFVARCLLFVVCCL